MNNYKYVRNWNNDTLYQNEKLDLHRLDGPAYIWSNGLKSYYVNGKFFIERDYWQHPDVLKYKMLQEAKSMLGLK